MTQRRTLSDEPKRGVARRPVLSQAERDELKIKNKRKGGRGWGPGWNEAVNKAAGGGSAREGQPVAQQQVSDSDMQTKLANRKKRSMERRNRMRKEL